MRVRYEWLETAAGSPGLQRRLRERCSSTQKGVLPLLEGAGDRLVTRLQVANVVHGSPSGMVLAMDFDSAESVTAMFESDDHAALIPVRDQGFKEMNILLTQWM